MRPRSSILVGLTIVSLSGSSVVAQTPARLESGARARIVTPTLPAEQQIVQIEAAANDTIVFRSEKYPVTRSLALSEISALDVSVGHRRQTARGAIIGLGTGIALGAIAGYATYEPCEGFCILGPQTQGQGAAWGGIAGGVLGLVAGTTIGFLTKSEKWQRVHTRTTVGVSPVRGGRQLAVSHSF
jgi:hypothetical protein